MEKSRFPLVMKSVAVVSTLCALLLCLLYRYNGSNVVLTFAISFGTTAYHFIMRLLVGTVVLKVTGNRFSYDAWWFRPKTWEPGFYRLFHVRSWKGSIPTYAPEQFSMKENSLHRIIQNMCGAEVVHEIIIALSFLPLLAVPFLGSFPAFLITSVLAALFDSIFVMAQRYNRPRLIRIYERQEARGRE